MKRGGTDYETDGSSPKKTRSKAKQPAKKTKVDPPDNTKTQDILGKNDNTRPEPTKSDTGKNPSVKDLQKIPQTLTGPDSAQIMTEKDQQKPTQTSTSPDSVQNPTDKDSQNSAQTSISPDSVQNLTEKDEGTKSTENDILEDSRVGTMENQVKETLLVQSQTTKIFAGKDKHSSLITPKVYGPTKTNDQIVGAENLTSRGILHPPIVGSLNSGTIPKTIAVATNEKSKHETAISTHTNMVSPDPPPPQSDNFADFKKYLDNLKNEMRDNLKNEMRNTKKDLNEQFKEIKSDTDQINESLKDVQNQLKMIHTQTNLNKENIELLKEKMVKENSELGDALTETDKNVRENREKINYTTGIAELNADFMRNQEKALRMLEFADSEKQIMITGLSFEKFQNPNRPSNCDIIEQVAKEIGMDKHDLDFKIGNIRVAGAAKTKTLTGGKVLPKSAPIFITMTNRDQKERLLQQGRNSNPKLSFRMATVFPQRLQPIADELRKKSNEIHKATHKQTRVVSKYDRQWGYRLVLQSKEKSATLWEIEHAEANNLFENQTF
jgi:hypothetical protein